MPASADPRPDPQPDPQPDLPRKPTLGSRIAEELTEAILSGRLAPGAKINLDRLRAQMKVSVSPLREAVARLTGTGLVRFEDQRGYSVAPVGLRDLAELVTLRLKLEPPALEAAMARGDLDWESAVMAALHRLETVDRGRDRDGWERAFRGFHLALVAGCGEARRLGLIADLRLAQDRYRRLLIPGPLEAPRALAEAAVARSPQAEAMLRLQIAATGGRLARALETLED